MNDDELKALYKDSSKEQPSENIDARILAEAEQELHSQNTIAKTRRTGWRPIFATAASLTLVVALAFQLVPTQQLQLEPEPEAVHEPIIVAETENDMSGATMASDQEIAPQSAPITAPKEATADAMNTFQAKSTSTAEEQPSAADHAHSRADKLRQARIAERQRKRKMALQEQARAELATLEEKQIDDTPLISTAGLQQELKRILNLYENDQVDAAKSAWQQLQSMNIKAPESEPNKSLWIQLAALLD